MGGALCLTRVCSMTKGKDEVISVINLEINTRAIRLKNCKVKERVKQRNRLPINSQSECNLKTLIHCAVVT